MSQPSPAQIEANRRNAKYGRGPNSARGKQHSSRNAVRHGLTGRIVVLPTEDMEAYKAFSKELVDSLNPETPMERQFAQTVADTQWRLNRARTYEDGMLALGHFEQAGNFEAGSREMHSALTAAKVFRDNSKTFVNLSLYEQRLSRAQKEAFRQLRELQAERKALLSRIAPVQEPIARAAAASATPGATNACGSIPSREPEAIGFVYAESEYAPGAFEDNDCFYRPGDVRPPKTVLPSPEQKAA